MKFRTKLLLPVALAATMILAGSAVAGTSWICSINSAVACDEDGTIGPPDLGELAAPTFIRVDIGAKKVTLLAPESRRGEVNTIDTIVEGDGVWVLSGVQDNRAWSMVIADAGYMTLTVTTDGATWSIFGGAMRED